MAETICDETELRIIVSALILEAAMVDIVDEYFSEDEVKEAHAIEDLRRIYDSFHQKGESELAQALFVMKLRLTLNKYETILSLLSNEDNS